MENKDIKNRVRNFLTGEELKQTLGEGLIMTHSLNKTINFLQRYYSKFKIISDDENNLFVLMKREPSDVINIDFLIKYLNNWGWFLSAYLKDGELIKSYEGDDYEGLRFEAKFDIS